MKRPQAERCTPEELRLHQTRQLFLGENINKKPPEFNAQLWSGLAIVALITWAYWTH